MIVHFYRHAPSRFNVFGEETIDCPLNLTDQTKQMCKQMSGEYDIIICSTLKRARNTLDLSNITHKEFIIYTNKCRERRGGNKVDILEGESLKDTLETDEQFHTRTEIFLNSLKKLSKCYNKIAVISHGHFIHHITGEMPYNCGMVEYVV